MVDAAPAVPATAGLNSLVAPIGPLVTPVPQVVPAAADTIAAVVAPVGSHAAPALRLDPVTALVAPVTDLVANTVPPILDPVTTDIASSVIGSASLADALAPLDPILAPATPILAPVLTNAVAGIEGSVADSLPPDLTGVAPTVDQALAPVVALLPAMLATPGDTIGADKPRTAPVGGQLLPPPGDAAPSAAPETRPSPAIPPSVPAAAYSASPTAEAPLPGTGFDSTIATPPTSHTALAPSIVIPSSGGRPTAATDVPPSAVPAPAWSGVSPARATSRRSAAPGVAHDVSMEPGSGVPVDETLEATRGAGSPGPARPASPVTMSSAGPPTSSPAPAGVLAALAAAGLLFAMLTRRAGRGAPLAPAYAPAIPPG